MANGQSYIFLTKPSNIMVTYAIPTPLNAVDHSYMDYTTDYNDNNSDNIPLIVGQVTSYEDVSGV